MNLRSPEYVADVLTTILWCLWNAYTKIGMYESTYLWFVWGFFKILLWLLAFDASLFHRNTQDLVTPNFLLEVHIRALLNTSGSFSAIESQCVMKYRGEEFLEMLTVMQCPGNSSKCMVAYLSLYCKVEGRGGNFTIYHYREPVVFSSHLHDLFSWHRFINVLVLED